MGKDVIGEINFYSGTTDGKSPLVDTNPTFVWLATNYVLVPKPITIHDLRGEEGTVNIDTHGFEVAKYDGQVSDVYDDRSETHQIYKDELANILKTRLGASRVIPFHHVMRARGRPRTAGECDSTHKNPIFYPHADNDTPGARLKVKEVLGEEEGEKAMQKRFQIINVWRPLGPNPITNTPLTVCDYSTIDVEKDVHVSGAVHSGISTSYYILSHNNEKPQKWYYMNQMKSDEMFIWKSYDSDPNVAQFGAHTAFIDKSISSTDTEQYSIDMRSIVLYD